MVIGILKHFSRRQCHGRTLLQEAYIAFAHQALVYDALQLPSYAESIDVDARVLSPTRIQPRDVKPASHTGRWLR